MLVGAKYKSPARFANSPFAEIVSDDGLVEPLAFVQELGNVFWGVLKEVVLQ